MSGQGEQMNWLDQQLSAEEPAQESEPAPSNEEIIEGEAPEIHEAMHAKDEGGAEESESASPAQAPAPAPQQPQHTIPLAELMKERDKAREYKTQADLLQSQLKEMREQLEAMKNPPEPEPDPEEDPAGYLRYQQQKLNERTEHLEQQIKQKEQAQKQAELQQQVVGHIRNYEAEFTKQAPDYQDALAYMRQAQYNQLAQQGYGQQQALQIIQQNEMREAVQLMALGYNPSEVIYNKARKFGYAPKAEEPNSTQEPKADLSHLDKAARAAKGSGNKGGDMVKDMLTAPDDQFNEIWGQVFGGAKRY